MTVEKIAVEIVYALPDKQYLLTVQVNKGAKVLEAVRQAGVTKRFNLPDLNSLTYGVFSEIIKNPRDYEVKQGERIEIYRPLIRDPKMRRKTKAVEKSNRQ